LPMLLANHGSVLGIKTIKPIILELYIVLHSNGNHFLCLGNLRET
jgi:hypothetical protein